MEKPGEDATSAEIAEWMEESHTEAITEALEESEGDVTAEE